MEKGVDPNQKGDGSKSAISTKDIKFKDFYPDIKEDHFESSDDEERDKTMKLEKLETMIMKATS